MGLPMSSAIDRVLSQRELVLRGMHRADIRQDEWQLLELEDLLDTLDSVLVIVPYIETRH